MTIYANNVAGTLAANIGPSDTLVLLGAGQGAKFPSPTGGNYFYATLVHVTTGVVEIVQCTARSVDTLTVVRGRDGTTATSFTTGSVVEMRLCAIMLTELDYKAARGVANGIASLDGASKIPTVQLPVIPLANLPSEVVVDTELNSALSLKANKAGDTFTGEIVAPTIKTGGSTGGDIKVGDDAKLLDVNIVHTLCVRSQTNDAFGYLVFGNNTTQLGWNGSQLVWGSSAIWHGGNFDPSSKLNTSNPAASGTMTVSGPIISSQDFRSSTANVVLATGSAGVVYLRPNGAGSSGGQATLDSGGTLSATNVTATSDRRLKESIEPRKTARGFADKIALYDWSWIEDGKLGTGVIAQDVEDFAPGYVYGSTTLSVDKAGLALEAIVDLAARVRQLEERAQHA